MVLAYCVNCYGVHENADPVRKVFPECIALPPHCCETCGGLGHHPDNCVNYHFAILAMERLKNEGGAEKKATEEDPNEAMYDAIIAFAETKLKSVSHNGRGESSATGRTAGTTPGFAPGRTHRGVASSHGGSSGAPWPK